jgi:signal transduction histidine kinase
MTPSSAHWSASDCSGDLPPPTLIESVGHGIRQPLMAINLYGAALREQLGATPALSTVKQIQQAGASLQNLFEDLLLVSQLASSRLAVRLQSLPIGSLLNRLADQFVVECESVVLEPELLTLVVQDRTAAATLISTDPALFARLVFMLMRLFESVRPAGTRDQAQVLRLEADDGQVILRTLPADRQPVLFDLGVTPANDPSRNPHWVLACQLAQLLQLNLIWQTETVMSCSVRMAYRIE